MMGFENINKVRKYWYRTSTPQLLHHHLAIKELGALDAVGLDTAHVLHSGALDDTHQSRQLGFEFLSHGRCFEKRLQFVGWLTHSYAWT